MLANPAKVYILLHALLLKSTKSSQKVFFFQKCIDFSTLTCYNVLARKTAQGHIRKEYPMVQFMNSEHEKKYYSVLARMRSTDCYHRAIAYLFTLDSVCKNHISEVYDFKRGYYQNGRSAQRLADRNIGQDYSACVQPLEHLH